MEPSANQPQRRASTSSSRGRGRQGVGEAFFMSLLRQIARSIGQVIVRALMGSRGR